MRLHIAIAAALLLSACATADPAQEASLEGRDCFRADDVSGFGVIDDNTVRVTVGANRDYALATQASVRDLRWDQSLALRARPSGWVCTGEEPTGVEIFGGAPIARSWHVSSVSRIPEPPAGS